MDVAKLRWLQFPGQRDLDEIDRDLSDRVGETKKTRGESLDGQPPPVDAAREVEMNPLKGTGYIF
jgi:hypothetical protein